MSCFKCQKYFDGTEIYFKIKGFGDCCRRCLFAWKNEQLQEYNKILSSIEGKQVSKGAQNDAVKQIVSVFCPVCEEMFTHDIDREAISNMVNNKGLTDIEVKCPQCNFPGELSLREIKIREIWDVDEEATIGDVEQQ